MRKIIINKIEYKYNCVYATKRAMVNNIGVHLQLQVFKNGIQLDKKDFNGYIQECIERDIVDRLNQ